MVGLLLVGGTLVGSMERLVDMGRGGGAGPSLNPQGGATLRHVW